jgi:hypothetical protein
VELEKMQKAEAQKIGVNRRSKIEETAWAKCPSYEKYEANIK